MICFAKSNNNSLNSLINFFPKLLEIESIFVFFLLDVDVKKTYNSKTDFHKKYQSKCQINTTIKNKLIYISTKYFDYNPNPNDIYSITRIVYSYDNLESYRGHFDSHLFTLVTPVKIPRINDNKIIFDIRSSFEADDEIIIDALKNL